jgi:hypothetical protein
MTGDKERSFKSVHPFVLKDGRRFKSLYCAAHSVFDRESNPGVLLPVIDESTGVEYGIGACRIAANGPTPGLPASRPLSCYAVTS